MEIFGREDELTILRQFVDETSGPPAAVVVAGEPGIGKTALWTSIVAHARERSHRVLTSRPGSSETQLSFAGLRDLLHPHAPDVLDVIPGPQRHAVAVALLIEESEDLPAGAGAVAAGVLGIIRALAAEAPVLVAIDDVQWLDEPTASVLEFVARRVSTECVSFALSLRTDGSAAVPLGLDRALSRDRISWLTVGPLSMGALQRTLGEHLGFTCARPVLRRLHDASGGNPFFALELARALRRTETRPEPGAPLPAPSDLRQLVADRLGALGSEVQAVLLAVSALAEPVIEMIEKAAPHVDVHAAVAAAADEGVLERAGARIRFTHPLLGSGVYSSASPSRRRSIHRRLAEAVDDPQERARHLSLSTGSPDEAVAALIEHGGREAWQQGAPYPAAEMCDRAAQLTPPDHREHALRRRIDAATYYFEAGDTSAATVILEEVIAQTEGSIRLQALCRLARIFLFTDQLTRSAQAFGVATTEATDPVVRIEAEEGLAWTLLLLRKDISAAARHARTAAALAEEHGHRAAISEALGAAALAEFLLGKSRESASAMKQALSLGAATEALPRVLRHPRLAYGFVLTMSDEFDAARSVFRKLHDRAEERGDESALTRVLLCLSNVEFLTGNWQLAETHLIAAMDAAGQTGQYPEQGSMLYDGSVLDAHLGRLEAARHRAQRGLERADDSAAVSQMIARRTLGAISLVTGKWEDGCRYLGELVEHFEAAGVVDPGAAPFFDDYIEALLALGHLEEAEAALRRHHGRAEATGRVSALASSLRGRGLLNAAQGRPEEAVTAFEASLRLYNQVTRPFDRARTLLCMGMVQRRAKQKSAARRLLGEARAVFGSLGAQSWLDKSETELAHIGGRAPGPGALTPSETRVAHLAAQGLTTKEIAAQLFVSTKTVEGHLSNVYAKLAVRSRTELARTFGRDQAAEGS
ncbi:MAG: helix-turn-helix transcriptional regulator [Actinomycetota bacterium]